MYIKGKRLPAMITLLLTSLLFFVFVSPAAAGTTVHWTVKYNGEDISGQYVWGAGETRPVCSFQVPCSGDADGRKITVHYRLGLQQVELIPPSAPRPVPGLRPVLPDPAPKPAPDLRWPPKSDPGKPKPCPSRPKPVPVPNPEPCPSKPKPVSVPDPEPGEQPPGPKPVPVPDDPETRPAPQPGDTELSPDELQLFQLVNQERLQAGLSALKIHTGLVELARLKSSDMLALNYFAHQSPTYGSPFEMMQQAGIAYSYAGENLAGAPSVDRAHSSLMNSPGHRANILNPDFTHVGIGIVDGGPYGKMITQMFIKPR